MWIKRGRGGREGGKVTEREGKAASGRDKWEMSAVGAREDWVRQGE